MSRLTWEATYEIVQALKRQYPGFDLDTLSVEQLARMVITLPEFGDDPDLVNESILLDILREWVEEEEG